MKMKLLREMSEFAKQFAALADGIAEAENMTPQERAEMIDMVIADLIKVKEGAM